MAGTIRPNEMNVSTTPTLLSKLLPDLQPPKSESKKPAQMRAPRADVEPLYTTMKMSISDSDWTTYKTSINSFLLGKLNQEELTQRLDRILVTHFLENAHNKFMMGIYFNLSRDAPEPGVASWVSSSDKPNSGVVKGTGDESEKRMKHEVMQLHGRERKRLKTMHQASSAGPEAGWDPVGTVMQEYVEAHRVKLPESGPASAAGGYGKTSKYTADDTPTSPRPI
jgi:transcriptional coactivator HFI1/ADA1